MTEQIAVLIAEDSAKMLEQMIADVRALGVSVIGAKTGLEAVKLVNQHRPSLIVLDGLLPEMHGFEVARTIRKLDASYRPYIAIVTGVYKSTQYQNEARLKYGINDYLIKPIKKDALRDLLSRSLSFSFPEK